MAKTRHIQKRMDQRSISNTMLEMVKLFGVNDSGDKTILNKKGIEAALCELKKIDSTLQKMKKRGGIVLVEDENSDITTYSLNSFNQNVLH